VFAGVQACVWCDVRVRAFCPGKSTNARKPRAASSRTSTRTSIGVLQLHVSGERIDPDTPRGDEKKLRSIVTPPARSRGASWTCGMAEGTNVAVVGSGRFCAWRCAGRPEWPPTSERYASRSVTSCGRARPGTEGPFGFVREENFKYMEY